MTFKHPFLLFFIILLSFWGMTLWTYPLVERTAQINILMAIFYLLLINPLELDNRKRWMLLIVMLCFIVLNFFVSTTNYNAWLFVGFCLLAYFIKRSAVDYNVIAGLIIFCGVFFNLSFVTSTKIIDVQYDFASCYNYMEYILENNFLFWHENPLLTRPGYSSYHPILHFFIAAIAVKSGMIIGFSKEIASEGAQVLFVSYMIIYGYFVYKILRLFQLSKFNFGAMLLFVVFFPVYNAISGYFNNDCLLLPLQAGSVYYALLYYFYGGKKNLIYLSLLIGAATLTKLSGVLVLPMVGICLLLRLLNNKNKKTFLEIVIFGISVLLLIAIWPLYQYFVLDVGFSFVPPQTHLSLEKYSFWERFNPIKAFVYENMFYNDFGTNLWETMTKTALFGQWDFSYRGENIMPLINSFIFIYKIILAVVIVATLFLIFKDNDRKLLTVILSLPLGLLMGIIVFVMEHPYMCNQDFRYIAVLPLAFVMILARFEHYCSPKVCYLISGLLILFAIVSAFVWNYIVA